MRTDINQKYAVLTGDVVKSSQLVFDERQRVLSAIKDILHKSCIVFKPLEILGPEIYRGDGWQILLSEPRSALKVAFYLRACLKASFSSDTRIAIGIGRIEQMPKEGLAQASGEAFLFSGNGLDNLRKKEHMVCWFQEPVTKSQQIDHSDVAFSNLYLNTSLNFASRFADDWTKVEAWAVARTLEGLTQNEIAINWVNGERTTQQNVAKTLHRAGFSRINNLLFLFTIHMQSVISS